MTSNLRTFWQWFEKNQDRIFSFESNTKEIFDELAAEIHRIHPDLAFEFGPVLKEGRREFVISAGGIKAAFPAVESLYNEAPALSRWIWVKYRPRRASLCDIELGGKCVRVDDVRYMMARDAGKVGLILFFDGYSDKERSTFGQIGYLLLDEALGEFAVETQVGFISFQSRDSKYFLKSRPLKELQSQWDEYWRRSSH